ncbi:MAG: Tat pathway signal protein [Elusimicrobiota bacterium]
MKPAEMIWAYLIHISYNMWCDCDAPELNKMSFAKYSPSLRCDDSLWNDVTSELSKTGMNMLIIDLGDGIKYESHPEIAVENAWPVEKLKTELIRLRKLGLEPIPKLNFSTCHDAWLGKYSRMVSTDIYYGVCKDLIDEVVSIFGNPRFFHLGMDEETAAHQKYHKYALVRQYDLWWDDLYFYIAQLEKHNVRPWVWADYIWHYEDVFLNKMPKTVLQSNWYYGLDFGDTIPPAVKAYNILEKHKYDQVPTGSNYYIGKEENFVKTVDYCKNAISQQYLKGFMQSVWRPTLEPTRDRHFNGIECMVDAKKRFL